MTMGYRALFRLFLFCLMVVAMPLAGHSAPYAAMVIDARSGKVLHSRNADTRLHPASLTKMMTLYIAFEAVENGEISLDTMVRISKHAAAEPPSKLGLRAGQKIKLRYLIRAAAVKSANDAATAIGEAIEGSEAAFARRMTRTAKAMGMSRTTFKNAHGLTENGHLSTARDMTTLGRHLFYDYPDYYNLFSRKETYAGVKTVSSHNRLLSSYKGADGIKTGYTRAAGFNLVASAQRGNERIIATVFGGRSSATRNAEVARLLDLGFSRAPTRVAVAKPRKPAYGGSDTAGRVVRTVMTVKKSLVPRARPALPSEQIPEATVVALQEGVADAVSQVALSDAAAAAQPDAESVDKVVAEAVADAQKAAAPVVTAEVKPAPKPAASPVAKPITASSPRPRMRPESVQLATLSATPAPAEEVQQEVVTRMSTSGARLWGINVGSYSTSYEAERVLLKTALKELTTLDGALRKVAKNSGGFQANFVGMTEEQADLACRRLSARGTTCETLGPSS